MLRNRFSSAILKRENFASNEIFQKIIANLNSNALL